MQPPSNPTVRPARPADADAVGEIHVASWQVGYAGQMPGEYLDGLSIADRQRTWRQRLQHPTGQSRTVVVEADREVAGFSLFGPSRDDDAGDGTAELYAIYLHPRHWGRGLGRVLDDHIFTALQTQGYRLVTLWVLATNNRARGFYERMGWHVEGRTKTETIGNTGVTLDEIRYRRVLAKP